MEPKMWPQCHIFSNNDGSNGWNCHLMYQKYYNFYWRSVSTKFFRYWNKQTKIISKNKQKHYFNMNCARNSWLHGRPLNFYPCSQNTCDIYLFRARSLKILIIDSNPDILNGVQFWPSDRTKGLERGTPITAREVFGSISSGPETEVKNSAWSEDFWFKCRYDMCVMGGIGGQVPSEGSSDLWWKILKKFWCHRDLNSGPLIWTQHLRHSATSACLPSEIVCIQTHAWCNYGAVQLSLLDRFPLHRQWLKYKEYSIDICTVPTYSTAL